MSDIAKKPNQTPESYSPKKPEIANMMKEAVKNEQNLILPSEYIITPKDKIAPFSGDRWPYSNVEPAIYGALGLFYGRTENRDDTGALINSDIEYSIHNVLTGHAFGLFYCWPDDSLSMAAYGFSSFRLEIGDYSEEEIITIIKDQIYHGNAVHIDEGNGPFDYLIWGYKDNGNVLLGYKFEHGNDMVNCSYDFETPSEFDSLTKGFSDVALYKPNGEKLGGLTVIQPDGERLDKKIVYRQALSEGYRMLTQVEPPPAMDFSRVHFGYGQAIYDEWIRQLEQANVENSEAFYFASPIFPHFIALYENRLHLYKFLKIYAEMCDDNNLLKAAELCERLKDMAQEGAQIGFENKWSDPKILAMTNNERRNLLINLLKNCRTLELEIAGHIKIFIDSPESYSPKKPEIASLMKNANKHKTELIYNQNKKILDNVLPLNSPWVGCCEFLKSFTSMLLKAEYDSYSVKPTICIEDGSVAKLCVKCGKCDTSNSWYVHRDRVYKSLLPIAGTGLTNAFDPIKEVDNPFLTTYGNINQSYFMTDGYIEKTFQYAGYQYDRIEKDGTNEIELFNAVIKSIDNGIPVVCFYDYKWQLITGYDVTEHALYLCHPDKEQSIEEKDWYNRINFILPVTGKVDTKPTIKDILKNIMNILEQNEFNEITTGFAAYDKCVAFLSDDEHFANLNFDTLMSVYQEIHNYIGYHAEARGFSGEGFKLMAFNENAVDKLFELLTALSNKGWEHHGIAWDGWNAMKPWPCDPKENAELLRDKAVREIIIDSVERMKKNDEEIAALIKEYLK